MLNMIILYMNIKNPKKNIIAIIRKKLFSVFVVNNIDTIVNIKHAIAPINRPIIFHSPNLLQSHIIYKPIV